MLRLNKPVGIFLTLWPSLWALWIANQGVPPLKLIIIIVAGAIAARSAGCAINDIFDRNLDCHVERTRIRPLACKKITLVEAILLFITMGILAISLVLLLNLFSIVIALAAALLTILYPLAKRYTYFPQCVLGIVFNSGVLIAFAASTNRLPVVAWVLYAATVLWTISYDTMYAMADRADDLSIKIKSTAVLFSTYDYVIIGALQAAMFIVLVVVGLLLNALCYYYLGLIAAAIFSIYQQHLIQTHDRQQCLHAFLNNHWMGLVVFIGIALTM